MKVSVIVPVYNVEKYIERCAVSLFQQTLQEVEYIFVDDATPDASMVLLNETIRRFPERDVKILRHETNKGLPAARNTGLAIATGEYIFHCDSDDFVEPNMLEELYGKARETGADLVWSDWFLSYEHNERYMKQETSCIPATLLKDMLSGSVKYNVWNKLVSRDLYVSNGIQFPVGYSMGEDMTMMQLAACAEKVAYVPQAFYHYVKTNTEAMTSSISAKALADIRYNVEHTLVFLKKSCINDIEKEMAFFKQNIKLPFLISSNWANYRLWTQWYPESNTYIMQNKKMPLRTRIVQWMASRKLYVGVWLYYQFVYAFVYRIIYIRNKNV